MESTLCGRFVIGFGVPYEVLSLKSRLNNEIERTWQSSLMMRSDMPEQDELHMPLLEGYLTGIPRGVRKELLRDASNNLPRTVVGWKFYDIHTTGTPSLVLEAKISGYETLFERLKSSFSGSFNNLPKTTFFSVPLNPMLEGTTLDSELYIDAKGSQTMHSLTLYTENERGLLTSEVSYSLKGKLSEAWAVHQVELASKYSTTNLTPPPSAPLLR